MRLSRTALLGALALVFTVGLTFATVELPYLVDQALQAHVATPGFDSQADEVSRLKTELFIAHYHLRPIGYLCFATVVLLVVVGLATRRSRLAMLGGLAFMLPVFAQFAGVMFFLAGLGLLNVIWLPVLDVSFDLAALGDIVRTPYDGLVWLFGRVGVDVRSALVYLCIGAGLLLFFLGTLAWLSAGARHRGVADFWVYRLSRHPQYLGWIIWSYGLLLLILQARYPKRSWGISPTLPWLVSTMVIIGVAMLEELGMRRRHGEAYEAYRRSAPFLFPLPAPVERALGLPFRMLFGKDRPDRPCDVAAVLGLCTFLLMAASFLSYGEGVDRVRRALESEGTQRARAAELAQRIRQEPSGRWVDRRASELAERGEPAWEMLQELLEDDDAAVRAVAARAFVDHPDQRAFPWLVRALSDESEAVRSGAYRALEALGSREAVGPLLALLDDQALRIRVGVVETLAHFKATELMAPAASLLERPEAWVRIGAVRALGTLGSEQAIPTLGACLRDPEATVRREAVVALLRIGSPVAIPALEASLDDADWEVRLYVAEALKRLGGDRRPHAV